MMIRRWKKKYFDYLLEAAQREKFFFPEAENLSLVSTAVESSCSERRRTNERKVNVSDLISETFFFFAYRPV